MREVGLRLQRRGLLFRHQQTLSDCARYGSSCLRNGERTPSADTMPNSAASGAVVDPARVAKAGAFFTCRAWLVSIRLRYFNDRVTVAAGDQDDGAQKD